MNNSLLTFLPTYLINNIRLSEINDLEKPFILYAHIIPKSLSNYDYDKYYIGVTSQKIANNRWKNGFGYRNQTLFYRAIEKYGWENINHVIISDKLTEVDAGKYEKEIIAYLKSNIPLYGYNIASGGYELGGSCVKIAQYSLNGNLIKVYQSIKEAKEVLGISNSSSSLSNAAKNHTQSHGYLWRYCEPDNIVQTIDNYLISTCEIPVLQYDIHGKYIKEWNSISEANEYYNISSVSNVCLGKAMTAGGYQWKYKDSDKLISDIANKNTQSKHIYVYTLDGDFISDFCSITEAVKQLGIKSKINISNCYNDITRNASHGYRWCNVYYEKLPSLNIKKKTSKAIAQIDKNNKVINIFDKINSACEIYEVSNSMIGMCCRGKVKHVKGFSWKYLKDISLDDIDSYELKERYIELIS